MAEPILSVRDLVVDFEMADGPWKTVSVTKGAACTNGTTQPTGGVARIVWTTASDKRCSIDMTHPRSFRVL